MDGIKGWQTLVDAMNAAGCSPEVIKSYEPNSSGTLSIVALEYGGYVVVRSGSHIDDERNQPVAAFTSLDHAALWLRDAIRAIVRKRESA